MSGPNRRHRPDGPHDRHRRRRPWERPWDANSGIPIKTAPYYVPDDGRPDFGRLANLRRKLAAPAWQRKLAELAEAADARPAEAASDAARAASAIESPDGPVAPPDATEATPGPPTANQSGFDARIDFRGAIDAASATGRHNESPGRVGLELFITKTDVGHQGFGPPGPILVPPACRTGQGVPIEKTPHLGVVEFPQHDEPHG
jgi:hypothetical protein